jgi:hypothetical protein
MSVTPLHKSDPTAAARARRYRKRRRAVTGAAPSRSLRRDSVTVAVTVAALALAAVSGAFSVTGMVAIFSAATVPVAVMTAVIEAAKLATAAWLARHWQMAPLLLRLPLATMVLLLMILTAAGTFGFLTRAHIAHQVEAVSAVDREAAPLEQRIVLAESAVRDFDARIDQLDDMVKAATRRGYIKTAKALLDNQSALRASLTTQRQIAAGKLAELKNQRAAIEARRARVASESGPALYIAKLFGSDNTEGMVRLITALLVLVLDPLAVLLVLAAAARPGGRHE